MRMDRQLRRRRRTWNWVMVRRVDWWYFIFVIPGGFCLLIDDMVVKR